MWDRCSAHEAHQVHSKEQIRASFPEGFTSRSQHSQFGFIVSMYIPQHFQRRATARSPPRLVILASLTVTLPPSFHVVRRGRRRYSLLKVGPRTRPHSDETRRGRKEAWSLDMRFDVRCRNCWTTYGRAVINRRAPWYSCWRRRWPCLASHEPSSSPV